MPQLVINSLATEQTIRPTDDSYVNSGGPDNNYGNFSSLWVEFTSRYRSSFLKFNIPNTEIESAYLRLYLFVVNSGEEGRIVIQDCADTTWTEGSITYNNRPNPAANLDKTINIEVGGDRWIEVDITDFIKARKGQAVTLTIMPEPTMEIWFSSKEGANSPEIKLGIVTPPPNIIRGQDGVRAEVGITNTGEAGTFYVRCSVIPSGETFGIDLYKEGTTNLDYEITLVENQSAALAFKIDPISGSATLGSYDSIAVARSGTGEVIDQKIEYGQLNVIEALPPVEIIPTDDCTLQAANPNQNFDNELELQVIGTEWNNENVCIIKFDISNHMNYSYAILKMVPIFMGQNPAMPRGIFIINTLSNWSEGSVTWNNSPAVRQFGIPISISVRDITPEGYIEIDITALYGYAKSVGDNKLSLEFRSDLTYGITNFASKDGVYPQSGPKLILF